MSASQFFVRAGGLMERGEERERGERKAGAGGGRDISRTRKNATAVYHCRNCEEKVSSVDRPRETATATVASSPARPPTFWLL